MTINTLFLIQEKNNEEVWSAIRVGIKIINGGKERFMKKTTLELKLILKMIYH